MVHSHVPSVKGSGMKVPVARGSGMRGPSVKCPYCQRTIREVGRDAVNCTSCGAYAVHEGSGIFRWHKRIGMMGQIVKNYNW